MKRAKTRGYRVIQMSTDAVRGCLGMKPATYIATELPEDLRIERMWAKHNIIGQGAPDQAIMIMVSSETWEGPAEGQEAPEIMVMLYHDPRILADLRERFGPLPGPSGMN